MGIVYDNQQNYDAAIEAYQKAIEINPNMNILPNIGWIYFVDGKIKEAKPYFEKSTSTPESLMNLGHIALIENNKEEAINLYKQSLSKFEDKNIFFEGMEDDFQYLEKQGINKEVYQKIIEDLKQIK